MTRVEFIFNVEDKLAKTADLCEKAIAKNRQLTIAAEEDALFLPLQNAIWQYSASSFLPIYHLTCPQLATLLPEYYPVHFCVRPAEGQSLTLLQDDILINFQQNTPTFFSRFRYLVELVGRDEQDKIAARARFKFYRDRGYEIKTTDMVTS